MQSSLSADNKRSPSDNDSDVGEAALLDLVRHDEGRSGSRRSNRNDPPGSIDSHRSFVLEDDYHFLEGGDDDCHQSDGQDLSDRTFDSEDQPEEDLLAGASMAFAELNADNKQNDASSSSLPSDGVKVVEPDRSAPTGRAALRSSNGTIRVASRGAPRRRPAESKDVSAGSPSTASPTASNSGSSVLPASPETKIRGVVRSSSAEGPRTPSQRSRRMTRSVARSKSCDDSIVALQKAAATTSRRTPTRKRRTVVRSLNQESPQTPRKTNPTMTRMPSSTDMIQVDVEGSERATATSENTGERVSGNPSLQAAKPKTTSVTKSDISTPGSIRLPQRNSRLSKSTHTTRVVPSRRPNRPDSSSRGKVRSRSSEPPLRKSSSNEAGEEIGEPGKSLDSKTFHVRRLLKDGKKGSKDSMVSSSLQLNIGDPSNVDVTSFPAFAVAGGAADSSQAPSSALPSSLLQLDIGNPSVVNECSFPCMDDAEPCPEKVDAPTMSGANRVLTAAPAVRESSSAGLLSKVQSHILRHPIFTSQGLKE